MNTNNDYHRKYTREERKAHKRDIARITKIMKKNKQVIGGELHFLDARAGVRFFADVIMGKELQHFRLDDQQLKIGNIIDGNFISKKDQQFSI